ncbi:MAG TPA: alpha-glucosidase C-terminal domain-containing protein, partial [Castellaniella sp.]|nr:alpha-glucosidase C-terminal domain-containing protein [Castellaniella sp.]
PITDIMRQTPEIPESCQWVIFLRNHDELTLEMVTSRERDYLWNVYAADPRARLNLGIRRRLAPLLERDRRRIELMSSLLLSMPGTPVLYYGDELGMGDNIHLGDRDGVRTPMQWSGDRNGGFSRADPERLHLPVLMGPLYGYEAVNVEAQQRDPHSLLNWTRRLLARRALTPAFGRGTLQFLYPGNRKILAYLRQWQDTTILCVANLSAAAQPVELPLQGYAGQVPVEMLGETVFPTIGELPYLLTLPPFGFYWFDLSRSASPPDWHVDAPEQMPELITLVLRARGALELTEISRKVLETEVLPQYLRRQRWFAGPPLPRIRWCDALPLPEAGRVADATHGRYFWATALPAEADDMRLSIPLSLTWGEPADATYPIAHIRRVAETGVLADAFSEAEFVHALVDGLAASPHGSPDGAPKGDSPRAHLRFQRIAPDWQAPPADAEVRWLSGEQSNSSAIVGDAVMIKVLRTVMAGPNAEVEMSQRLTEAGYAHTPPLLGTLEHRTADGTARTLAVFHRYVSNEGDAWTWTQETVRRLLAAAQLAGDDEDAFEAGLSGYWSFARTMGERLAMLHAVFVPADASAAPTSQTTEYRLGKARDVKQTVQRISAQLDAALRAAAQQLSATAPLGEPLQWLQEHQAELTARIQALAQDELGVARIR